MVRKSLVALLGAVVLIAVTGFPAIADPAPDIPAASQTVRAVASAATTGAPTSPTDESKVPHYFGPYPNWANSPQVLADALVNISLGTPTPVSFGNPLTERAFATDFATPPGTLGPVFVVLQNTKLPAGILQSFQTWNQGTRRAARPRRREMSFTGTCCAPTGSPTATPSCTTAAC